MSFLLNPSRFKAAAGGNPGGGGASNTVLLVHFDGADEATSAVDSSASGHALTFSGNAQLDTAEKVFGTASLQILGDSGAGLVEIPSSDEFHFGADPFGIRFFLNPQDVIITTRVLIQKFSSDADASWAIFQVGSQIRCNVYAGDTSFLVASASGALAAGAWRFISFTFDGSKYRLHVGAPGGNASMVGSSTTPRSMDASTANVRIGANQSGFSRMDGHIDELQIVKGSSFDVTDAGFPVPTAAFTS